MVLFFLSFEYKAVTHLQLLHSEPFSCFFMKNSKAFLIFICYWEQFDCTRFRIVNFQQLSLWHLTALTSVDKMTNNQLYSTSFQSHLSTKWQNIHSESIVEEISLLLMNTGIKYDWFFKNNYAILIFMRLYINYWQIFMQYSKTYYLTIDLLHNTNLMSIKNHILTQ